MLSRERENEGSSNSSDDSPSHFLLESGEQEFIPLSSDEENNSEVMFHSNEEMSLEDELDELNRELNVLNYNWSTQLKEIIQTEFEILFDKNNYELDLVKQAFENIFLGHLENVTPDRALAKDLVTILELLSIRYPSSLYERVINRNDKDKNLPSVKIIKLSFINMLEAICKAKDINSVMSADMKLKIIMQDKSYFIPGKKYNFSEMQFFISQLTEPHKINLNKSNIFSHSLLLYAKILEYPAFCKYTDIYTQDSGYYTEKNITYPGRFYIHLAISQANMRKFVNFYNQLFGDDTVERISGSYPACLSAVVSMNSIVKLVLSEEFRTFFKNTMLSGYMLDSYLLLSNGKFITDKEIVQLYVKQGKKYGLNCFSDFFEGTVLHAFGVKEKLKTAQFGVSKRYEGFATEIDLHLGISPEGANNLVTAINAEFPFSAKLIEENVRLASRGDVALQLISIKSTVIISNEFLNKFSLALDDIAANKVDLLETYQVNSKTRKHTTLQLSENLTALAQEYNEISPNLSRSLSAFSLFTYQRKSKEELLAASFEVEKAIAEHESKLPTIEEYTLFKRGKKKEIKLVQQELGTRIFK
ncbi:MAG: hypothetical protein P4M12_08305 [Gammaproteobacteria bacterium]|nr:hypothetical protein [Gammaproteobacteria bacterium]